MIARSGSTPTGDGPAGNEGARTLEAMLPFHELFPEIGLSETRSARVLQKDEKLPADSYGFVELFCVDPKCDCRRVMINVLSEDRPAHLATINHAFEPPGPDAAMPDQTFLDPLNRQSRHSQALMDLFKKLLSLDDAHRQRIERHYRMVKDALADPVHPIHAIVRSAGAANGTQKLARRAIDPYAPCPCGSGKKYKWCCHDKRRV